MNYREDKEKSRIYKENYLNGIMEAIEKRKKKLEERRNRYARDIFWEPEHYREELKYLLGWPLIDYENEELPPCKSELLSEEDGYNIYRMQFEIMEGIEMSGLLFKLNVDSVPLVIVQHGGQGTPERISGIYDGDTSNYNDMLHRVRKQGVHVFAPQLLLWKSEEYGASFDRMAIDAKLKRVGSSITAFELYGIMKIIDYFQEKDYVSTFGMVGLSYGGFYALYTAALDTRIRSVISCSYYSSRDVYDQEDWCWFEAAEMFDDPEIAALIFPRRLCIAIGKDDPLFKYSYTVKNFNKLKKITARVGFKWLEELIVFDGEHEFLKDDAPIERMVEELNKEPVNPDSDLYNEDLEW